MWISAVSLSSSSATEANGSETAVSVSAGADEGRATEAKDEGKRAGDGDDDDDTTAADDDDTTADDNDDNDLALPAHPYPSRATATHRRTANYARPLPAPAAATAATNGARLEHEHEPALDPASSYTALITFSPPRSSSSYRLHDFVSSSPPRAQQYLDDDGEDEDEDAVPPVPRINWPLPVVAAGGDDVLGIEGSQAGDRRSAMSLSYGVTALPVKYMDEVYRPKPKPKPKADVSNVVGGENDASGAAVRETRKEKKGFRARMRGWLWGRKEGVMRKEGEESAGTCAGTEVEEEHREDEGEEIDFLEALRTTSPSRGPMGSRMGKKQGNCAVLAAQSAEEGEVAKLRRENQALKIENRALRAREM